MLQTLLHISPGINPPEDVNVIIEIPSGASPVKYELDKQTQLLQVDRFLSTSMLYPCNYGYIPSTLAGDSDPVDVLVVSNHSLVAGCMIRVRPIGVLRTSDEKGDDAKILGVPVSSLTRFYDKINSPEDFPDSFLEMIAHFFERYKDLEPGKWVKVLGWSNADAAKKEIMQGIEYFVASEK